MRASAHETHRFTASSQQLRREFGRACDRRDSPPAFRRRICEDRSMPDTLPIRFVVARARQPIPVPMDKLKIRGGTPLRGEIPVAGAKNAALPIIAASLLTGDELVVTNVPELADISTMARLLRGMGVVVERSGPRCALRAGNVTSTEAPYELVKTMRASVLVLGPLLARFGRARVSLPGGCAIGARPIDLHIKGFEKLGAAVHTEHGYIEAAAEKLTGAEVVFDKITVTGTE